MTREKGPAKASPPTDPAPYEISESSASRITFVTTERSEFLVIAAKFSRWKTLLFERHSRPDCWIMRREIDGEMVPERAVVGHLLKTHEDLDPISSLKRRLENFEKAFFRTLNENQDLKEKIRTLQIKLRK
jgi:hypothetical protein